MTTKTCETCGQLLPPELTEAERQAAEAIRAKADARMEAKRMTAVEAIRAGNGRS